MNKGKVFVISVLFFHVVLIFLSFVSAQGFLIENADTNVILEAFANNGLARIIFGNPGESLAKYSGLFSGLLPETYSRTSAIVIHLCFFAIFFVAFSDIFATFLPFSNKFVPWVIGGAFTIAFANLGFIPWIVLGLGKITAGLGAIAVFLGMIIAFVSFIGIAFAGNRLKYTILSKHRENAANAGAQGASTAIANLNKIAEEMSKHNWLKK